MLFYRFISDRGTDRGIPDQQRIYAGSTWALHWRGLCLSGRTGIFGSLQCYALYAGLRARDLKRRLQAKVSSMRALSAKATAICKNTGDYKWKKQVQKVADAIRYADPVSHGDTRQAEQQIDEALEQIRIAVRTENQKEFDEAAEQIRRSLELL